MAQVPQEDHTGQYAQPQPHQTAPDPHGRPHPHPPPPKGHPQSDLEGGAPPHGHGSPQEELHPGAPTLFGKGQAWTWERVHKLKLFISLFLRPLELLCSAVAMGLLVAGNNESNGILFRFRSVTVMLSFSIISMVYALTALALTITAFVLSGKPLARNVTKGLLPCDFVFSALMMAGATAIACDHAIACGASGSTGSYLSGGAYGYYGGYVYGKSATDFCAMVAAAAGMGFVGAFLFVADFWLMASALYKAF